MVNQLRKCASEFAGTYALVFFGTGAIVINQETAGLITHAGVAVTFGLIVMCMIYALGEVSGAHMNPAVSIAFTLWGSFPFKNLFPFISSQIAGAIAASATLHLLFPRNQLLGATLPAGSCLQSFVLEFLLTFFLMLVIVNVVAKFKDQKMFIGFAIGSTVALEALFAGPISGASMNPVRSLAPAIISGHTENLWVYLTATILGAAAAIPLCKFLLHAGYESKQEYENLQIEVRTALKENKSDKVKKLDSYLE